MRIVLDLSIHVPDRADRSVSENITSSDAGEIVRDANGDAFMLRIPGQADKLTVEYSGKGAWAAPALKDLQRGDLVTAKLMGLTRHEFAGVEKTFLLDGFSTTFDVDRQLVDWNIRLVEV